MRFFQLFSRPKPAQPGPIDATSRFLQGTSVEVTPRALAKLRSPLALPPGTVVFVAHIAGTGFEDMLAAACALRTAGHHPVPHLPARLIADRAMLADWLNRYRGEAGVDRALLLAGGVRTPAGEFSDSMQLVQTGLFDQMEFRQLFFAGHPEGSRDIDPDGGTVLVDQALSWKQALAQRTDARVALLTQFVFDAAPVIDWSRRIAARGIDLPIHVGLAAPARLQTLIKYALSCGVGPSVKVLQRRAADVTKLLLPYTPDTVAADLAAHVAAHPDSRIVGAHLFPLGGIAAATDWLAATRDKVVQAS